MKLRITNWTSFPTWDSNARPLNLEATTVTITLWCLIYYRQVCELLIYFVKIFMENLFKNRISKPCNSYESLLSSWKKIYFRVITRIFRVITRIFRVITRMFRVITRMFRVITRIFCVITRMFRVITRIFCVITRIFRVITRMFRVITRIFRVITRIFRVITRIFRVITRIFDILRVVVDCYCCLSSRWEISEWKDGKLNTSIYMYTVTLLSGTFK